MSSQFSRDYKIATHYQSAEKMFHGGLIDSSTNFLVRVKWTQDIHFPCEGVDRLISFTLSSKFIQHVNDRPNLHLRTSALGGRFHSNTLQVPKL